jgi:hypothetical protein
MPTPVLTRLLHEAVEHQAPQARGRFRPKLRYAHQGGMNPPRVVIHGNNLEHVTDSLQALPGRALARALQARGHALAHRDAHRPATPSTKGDPEADSPGGSAARTAFPV